jgi:hypothetical protein
MSPSTTEAVLEEQLKLAEESLIETQTKMKLLRNEMNKVETQLVEDRMKRDNIVEELRRFRLAYPSICRRTKD